MLPGGTGSDRIIKSELPQQEQILCDDFHARAKPDAKKVSKNRYNDQNESMQTGSPAPDQPTSVIRYRTPVSVGTEFFPEHRFRSIDGALNMIAGYEAMNIIHKGQIRWLPKTDVFGQKRFVEGIFGIAA
jgi:hypothetical protein